MALKIALTIRIFVRQTERKADLKTIALILDKTIEQRTHQ